MKEKAGSPFQDFLLGSATVRLAISFSFQWLCYAIEARF